MKIGNENYVYVVYKQEYKKILGRYTKQLIRKKVLDYMNFMEEEQAMYDDRTQVHYTDRCKAFREYLYDLKFTVMYDRLLEEHAVFWESL